MDIDREEVYNGLLKWITSLKPGSDAPSIQLLLTGKPLAEALVDLVPKYFNDEWIERTCGGIDDNSNWRVKSNGLKKLLKTVLHCYHELTGQTVSEKHIPDVLVAARDENKAEFGKLLQLVLVLAVNGSKRQDVIEHLMKLDGSVQHVAMTAIQELDDRKQALDSQTSNEEFEIKLKALQEELDSCRENITELSHRCHELDEQIDSLQDEKLTILAENERLQQKLAFKESPTDELVDEMKRFVNLQQETDRLHDDLFRLESSRDDFKAKFENAARDNKDLQAQLDVLSGTYDDYLKLKDEIDELKGKVADAKKLEATLDVYKRKLDEMNDVRMQLKILQEKNDSYMKCAIEADEERRRNAALKTQLESYKRQAHDLKLELDEETKRADKMEFQCHTFKDKLEALHRERDRLVLERDDLRLMREELKLTEFQTANPVAEADVSTEDTIAIKTALSENISDLKEQLLKLEHENRLLKLSQTSVNNEEVQLLSDQLEDANKCKREMEIELRAANKKIIELEVKLSDFFESHLGSDDRLTKSRVDELQLQAEKCVMEAQKAKQRCADLETQLGEKDQQQVALAAQLQSKVAELKQQATMYKFELEKAQTVIVTLEQAVDASNAGNDCSRTEFNVLRRQLEEKEKLIQRMQEDQEQLRVMKEQDERSVATGYHNMALQLRELRADKWLIVFGGYNPVSFLARQRFAHSVYVVMLLVLTLAIYFKLREWDGVVIEMTRRYRAPYFVMLHYVNGPPPV